jgi:hypothetical protein
MTPHESYTSLVAKVSMMNYNFITLGGVLRELKEGDRFKEAVGDTDTWQHFVKQPEVGLTVGEANKLIDLYTTFVLELGYSEEQLASISLKNLKVLMPVAKQGVQNLEELLEQARTLSDKDFKDALIETEDSLVEVPRTYKYVVMKVCNETKNMSKVHELTDEIKQQLNL